MTPASEETPGTGELIRGYRIKRGLKQWEVAMLVGVTRNTIANWECTGAVPRKHIHRLCEVLGMRLEDFFGKKIPIVRRKLLRVNLRDVRALR
jgi:DNA-binding XRE family transcriptional regulator